MERRLNEKVKFLFLPEMCLFGKKEDSMIFLKYHTFEDLKKIMDKNGLISVQIKKKYPFLI